MLSSAVAAFAVLFETLEDVLQTVHHVFAAAGRDQAIQEQRRVDKSDRRIRSFGHGGVVGLAPRSSLGISYSTAARTAGVLCCIEGAARKIRVETQLARGSNFLELKTLIAGVQCAPPGCSDLSLSSNYSKRQGFPLAGLNHLCD